MVLMLLQCEWGPQVCGPCKHPASCACCIELVYVTIHIPLTPGENSHSGVQSDGNVTNTENITCHMNIWPKSGKLQWAPSVKTPSVQRLPFWRDYHVHIISRWYTNAVLYIPLSRDHPSTKVGFHWHRGWWFLRGGSLYNSSYFVYRPTLWKRRNWVQGIVQLIIL